MTFPNMKDTIVTYMKESCPWQDSLLWFDSIESTNTHARKLAQDGAPHGTVLLADHQTGGRGRLGRSFHSPAGTGIYLSLILRPSCKPEELMHLTCAVAVALRRAVLEGCGLETGIKWTNDLVFGKQKLAGILTELGFTAKGTVDFAIIGIGLNCCQTQADFPEEIRHIAGSLYSVTGKMPDRAKVTASLLDALYRMDQQLLVDRSGILDAYRSACVTLGKEVSVVKADGTVRHGTALDIDEYGALRVHFPDTGTETVNSGEVSVRGMYGYL